MEYKLFEDYILLQSLLKDLRVISSGGAVKSFLADTTVLFNGEDEKRRRKKLRVGDKIEIPSRQLTINLVAPNSKELAQHKEEQAEKERVAAIVKKMNKKQEKRGQTQPTGRGPVKFPGT
ncbi:RNA-binding S4 domain-containing protein [Streptococcus dentasini]